MSSLILGSDLQYLGLLNMESIFQTLSKELMTISGDESIEKSVTHPISPCTKKIISNQFTIPPSKERDVFGIFAFDRQITKEQPCRQIISNMCSSKENSFQTRTLKLTTKILLLGDLTVGKTTIFETFERHHKQLAIMNDIRTSRNAADIKHTKKTSHGKCDYNVNIQREKGSVRMTVCDTAGQERYRSLTASYYRGAHGCLLVFDVTKANTFENLGAWYKDLTCYSTNPDMISLIIVGTNCHSDNREISKEKAEKFAEHLGLPYREVDKKNEEDVSSVFEELADMIIEHYKRHPSLVDDTSNSITYVSRSSSRQKKRCSC